MDNLLIAFGLGFCVGASVTLILAIVMFWSFIKKVETYFK